MWVHHGLLHVDSDPGASITSIAVDVPTETGRPVGDQLRFLLGQYHRDKMVQAYIHVQLVMPLHPTPTIHTVSLVVQWLRRANEKQPYGSKKCPFWPRAAFFLEVSSF